MDDKEFKARVVEMDSLLTAKVPLQFSLSITTSPKVVYKRKLCSFNAVLICPCSNWFSSKVGSNAAFALHCACYNKHCPSSVIELLLKEYASPITLVSRVKSELHKWGVIGLPLHHYLSRTSNIDIDIVKMLVEANPQSMLSADVSVTPLHVILFNQSANNLEGILGCLLKLSPLSIRVLDGDGSTPLQLACYNKHFTLEVVQMLYNAWPEALRMGDIDGYLPIHQLSRNRKLEEPVALSVLRFMIGIDPTLVREVDEDWYLPIHFAVCGMSTGFCKVLIDAYPDSLRVGRTNAGRLPINVGYYNERADAVDTIQYILELYPESTNVRDGEGRLPIHGAARLGRTHIIELLLKHDPDMVSKTTNNHCQLPLHIACCCWRVEAVQVLYDAFPEATWVRNGSGRTPLELVSYNCGIQVVGNQLSSSSTIVNFLQAQQAYAQKAKDMIVMTTPDNNGWLPLHHALKDKAPLGSIKLLLKGNPSALLTTDYKIAFPLHIACQFSSVKVVKYLVELLDVNGRILEHCDTNKDSILHYACCGGNCEVVKYLLTNHSSLVASVVANEKGELPLHLLCESGKNEVDIDSKEQRLISAAREYIETIWLMLLADPEALMS